MKPLTPWGQKVRQKLIEKSMSDEDLARAIGLKGASYIRQIFYGKRTGKRNGYDELINRYLGLDEGDKKREWIKSK